MNQIEECVYTLTDDANSLAAELYDTLEAIRYDPVGATPEGDPRTAPAGSGSGEEDRGGRRKGLSQN